MLYSAPSSARRSPHQFPNVPAFATGPFLRGRDRRSGPMLQQTASSPTIYAHTGTSNNLGANCRLRSLLKLFHL